MTAEVEQLIERAKKADQRRQSWQGLLRDVYAYAIPERDGFQGYGYGSDAMVRVFDSTAVTSTARFANRVQSALFPTQQKWAKLELAPGIRVSDAKKPGIAAGLEAVTDLVFDHIHASAFDQAINEWAQDLATGTAALLVQNGRLSTKRPGAPLLQIQAIPASAVAFDEGPHGTVEDVFFFQSVKARLIQRTYPDAALTQAMTAAVTAEPEREFDLLQATVFDPQQDAWFFRVICPGTKTQLLQRKHRSSPWIITRWSKAAREERGRGPLLQCLPDIRVANRLMEDLLVTGSFATSPIYTARDDGVLNTGTLQLMPGMVIPVRSNGGTQGPSLNLLPQPPAPQLAQWLLEGLQTKIRQTMFDSPLPPEIEAGITATEIIERMRQFQQDTGAFGRLLREAVVPAFGAAMDILDEAGELAAFGPIFAQTRDRLVGLRPTSLLAQAQDQAEAQAVFSFARGCAQLGEPGAAMLQGGLKLKQAGRHAARLNGVPAFLIPTEEEQAAAEKAAAEAQQTHMLATSPVAAQAVGAAMRAPADDGGPAAPPVETVH